MSLRLMSLCHSVVVTGTGWDRSVPLYLSCLKVYCCRIAADSLCKFGVLTQDILSFLENRKENRSWYKGSRIAVLVGSTFVSFFLLLFFFFFYF